MDLMWMTKTKTATKGHLEDEMQREETAEQDDQQQVLREDGAGKGMWSLATRSHMLYWRS